MACNSNIESICSTTILSHFIDVSIIQGAMTTSLVVAGANVDTLVDLFDDVWHSVVINVEANGDFDIFIDDSIIPTSGNDALLIGGTNQDLIIGDVDLSLFGVRIGGGNMDMSTFAINYIYKDLIENNGNVFFEEI